MNINSPNQRNFILFKCLITLKTNSKMLKRDQNIEELLEIEEKTPSKLLAWCTQTSNKASVLDLKTQQEYPTFEGV